MENLANTRQICPHYPHLKCGKLCGRLVKCFFTKNLKYFLTLSPKLYVDKNESRKEISCAYADFKNRADLRFSDPHHAIDGKTADRSA